MGKEHQRRQSGFFEATDPQSINESATALSKLLFSAKISKQEGMTFAGCERNRKYYRATEPMPNSSWDAR